MLKRPRHRWEVAVDSAVTTEQFGGNRTPRDGTRMGKLLSWLGWLLVALVGAGAFAWLALSRGEQVSAAWLVTAAVCTYLIAYRFYSRIHRVEDLRARRESDDARGAAE